MSVELDVLAEELTLRREIDEYDSIRHYNSDNNLHRVHGPAVIYFNGTEFWYQNNEVHRLDGPAVIWANGNRVWYQNGKRHRLDGPALIWANGVEEWYIDDKPYTEKQFNVHPDVIAYAKSKS